MLPGQSINNNMDINSYYSTLKKFDFSASSYEEIANCLMTDSVNQMYHVLANEADISKNYFRRYCRYPNGTLGIS